MLTIAEPWQAKGRYTRQRRASAAIIAPFPTISAIPAATSSAGPGLSTSTSRSSRSSRSRKRLPSRSGASSSVSSTHLGSTCRTVRLRCLKAECSARRRPRDKSSLHCASRFDDPQVTQSLQRPNENACLRLGASTPGTGQAGAACGWTSCRACWCILGAAGRLSRAPAASAPAEPPRRAPYQREPLAWVPQAPIRAEYSEVRSCHLDGAATLPSQLFGDLMAQFRRPWHARNASHSTEGRVQRVARMGFRHSALAPDLPRASRCVSVRQAQAGLARASSFEIQEAKCGQHLRKR